MKSEFAKGYVLELEMHTTVPALMERTKSAMRCGSLIPRKVHAKYYISETRRNNVYLAMTLPKSPSGNGGLPANQQTHRRCCMI